jgi:uncharacterized protein (TIGR03067 family)
MNATVLFAALAVGAPGLKDKPAPPPGLDGRWAIETRVIGGQPDPGDKSDHIRVAGGRWTILQPDGRTLEWAMDLDGAAKPPAFALYRTDDPGRLKPPEMAGIYQVDGDTVTMCYVFDGPRPTEFASPAGSRVRLMTLRRVKDK